jgi:hypothetical protein
LGQPEFQSFLNTWRVGGIASVLDKEVEIDAADPSISNIVAINSIEQLVNGTHYHLLSLPRNEVNDLREALADSIKAKADFGTRTLLSKSLGKKIFFRANDVILTDAKTKNSLGDVDSLFSSDDGTVVVLLERKGTLSMDSLDSLVSQVDKTSNAFLLCAKRQDPKLIAHLGHIDINQVRVIRAVFCTAGPAEAFSRLQQEGIFVIKESVELFELPEQQQSN